MTDDEQTVEYVSPRAAFRGTSKEANTSCFRNEAGFRFGKCTLCDKAGKRSSFPMRAQQFITT